MNISNFFQLDKIIPLDGDGCLEIMGYKLHTDDLLIIALMLFLYSQKISDKYIFIALLLLLFS